MYICNALAMQLFSTPSSIFSLLATNINYPFQFLSRSFPAIYMISQFKFHLRSLPSSSKFHLIIWWLILDLFSSHPLQTSFSTHFSEIFSNKDYLFQRNPSGNRKGGSMSLLKCFKRVGLRNCLAGPKHFIPKLILRASPN